MESMSMFLNETNDTHIVEDDMFIMSFPELKNITCLTKSYKIILTVSLLISVLSIVLTMITYKFILETKTMHGKILMSLSGCLGFSYILLIFDLYLKPVVPISVCQGLAILTYMALVSSFFWTNIMTYDIWKTISTMEARPKTSQMKKYFMFSIYAWSASLLITSILTTFAISNILPEYFRPNIIGRICWLHGPLTSIFFQSLPIGMILISNMTMFILTTKALLRAKNETTILQQRNEKQWFQLYIKLFFAFGMIWLTVFIPLICDITFEAINSDIDSCSIHLVVDVVNSLHGVFLFIIFVCKKSIYQQLQIKYTNYSMGFYKSQNTKDRQMVAFRNAHSNNNNIITTKL